MAVFLTLSDELDEVANVMLADLRHRGYRVRTEPALLELPATPAMRATRGHETHYVLVKDDWTTQEVEQWHRYACSCPADTRVTICSRRLPPQKRRNSLNGMGIGLTTINGNVLREQFAARDVAFHAQAPDRRAMKPRVRALLGEALDRFERGDWRPAFEDACGILEEECRKYLLRNLRMGRAAYQAGKKIKSPTAEQIRKLTLGGLKDVFGSLVSQNQVEAQLGIALTKLNPDRIRRVHKRRAKTSEAAVRKRVGQHFWLITNTLSLLV